MILKDISFPTPRENLSFDEELLNAAEQGYSGEALRFWESNQYFVVLGRISKEEEDVKITEVHRDRISVLRRASGGGTVLQGPGCLNYSLILSKDHDSAMYDLHKSYAFILNHIVQALGTIGVEAVFLPISDIALKENFKKISGNSQKRGRQFILHHGTILYDFDLKKIEQYLTVPKDLPAYRQGRSHSDFVTNVLRPKKEIKDAIQKVFFS
jgi:lipoate-protein ligase A